MNFESLKGKTVAASGCTGGLGRELCFYLASLGAKIVMLNRNQKKSEYLITEILGKYPETEILNIIADMEDINSVKSATEELILQKPDVFIANAGAYDIPRHICETGFDNVFQINFVSPYYIIKKLKEALPETKIVAVGSIAHNYSKTNPDDIDFSCNKHASKVYGNAKRHLMFSLLELFKDTPEKLAIVHPGISFTGITDHYPKIIFAIIKHPMKIIFMKPKKATLSTLWGIYNHTPYPTWCGPWLFNVWGLPKLQKLNTCTPKESERVFKTAEKIFEGL